jgi:hypothetical protein
MKKIGFIVLSILLLAGLTGIPLRFCALLALFPAVLFLFHHLYSAHGNAVEGRSIVFASFAINWTPAMPWTYGAPSPAVADCRSQ